MPAQLRIAAPGSPPVACWVQAEVVRLGSSVLAGGAGLDIEIEGVPAHFATLLFRDGRYLLANRSGEPIRLGRKSVATGEVVVWCDGAAMETGGGVAVTLVCAEDPRPVRVEAWAAPADLDSIDREREARDKKRKDALCLTIAACALFASAVMLNQPRVDASRVRCERVLQTIDELPQTEAVAYRGVRDWLLTAYSLERRGESEKARKVYLQARDQVARTPAKPGSETARLEVLNYLYGRLSAT